MTLRDASSASWIWRAQRLERPRVHRILRQELERFAARGVQVAAHRRELSQGVLDDRLEALLLLLGGVDLDVEVLEPALEVLLELRRIDRVMRPAVAALRECAEARGSGRAADKGCRGKAPGLVHGHS